jgi:hypothetical protein
VDSDNIHPRKERGKSQLGGCPVLPDLHVLTILVNQINFADVGEALLVNTSKDIVGQARSEGVDLSCCQTCKLDYGRHHIDLFLNVAQVDLMDFKSREL